MSTAAGECHPLSTNSSCSHTPMSSSNYPPQLHLSLPANATSFKRSFEQFGFDLESPSALDPTTPSGSGTQNLANTSSASDGNDRNKRARSSSPSVESVDAGDRSDSGTSSSSASDAELSALSATRPAILSPSVSQAYVVSSFLEPPRLPTPDLPDIEMIDYQSEDSSHPFQSPPTTLDPSDRLRLSLDRFNAFDSQISVLRGPRPRSPSAVQSPSPPPVLPPLAISLDDRSHLNAIPNPFSLRATDPLSPPRPYLDFEEPSTSTRSGSDTGAREHSDTVMLPHETHVEGNSNPGDRDPPVLPFITASSDDSPAISSFHQTENSDMNHAGPSLSRPVQQHEGNTSFRDRLDSALDILRSRSPLFADFNDEPPSDRSEGVGFTPLPRIRTQADEDRSWGVPWFSHQPNGSHDTFPPTETRFGAGRASTSPPAPPPLPRTENRRDTSPPARLSPFGRMGRERDIHGRDDPTPTPDRIRGTAYSALLTNLARARRDADAYLAHLSDLHGGPPLGSGSATSISPWEDGPDATTFIAHGLLDPNEQNNHRSPNTRLGNVSTLPSSEFRRPGPADNRWEYFENSDQEHHRWPSTMRQAMQNRQDRWHAQPDSREPRPLSQVESPGSEQRSFDQNWRRWSSIPGLNRSQSDHGPFRPVRPPRIPPPEPMPSRLPWSRLSDHPPSASSPTTAEEPPSSIFPPYITSDSSSSSDEDDGFISITRWPLGSNHLEWEDHPSRETGPQTTTQSSRPPRDSDIQERVYPWLDLPGSRTERDNLVLPSRFSWTSRRSSVSRSTASGRASYADSQDGAPSIPNFNYRSSTASDHEEPWGGFTMSSRADMTENEGETSSGRDDVWSLLSTAERSRSSVRDRLPRIRRASSPPRVPFSLPTPDFSPVFNPLPEGMEPSPPLSPQREVNTGPQPWRRSSVNANESMFRLSSPPPPVWEARPRQPSPLRLPMPRDLPRNSSVYRNIDLNAYHDGSFRASLQRFIELDRVRSRLSRLETMANEMNSGPSQPPSLPPLRFDYDLSLLNSIPPQAEGPSIPTSAQNRYSSSINSEHRIGNSFEERRGSVRFHERLRDHLRHRAPPVSMESTTAPPVPGPSIPYRARPSSMEMPERRETSIFSGLPRFGSRRTEREAVPRGQVSELDPVMNDVRRDVFGLGRQAQRVEESWRQQPSQDRPISWNEYDGETEEPRLSPFRRRFSRRSPEIPRFERHFPIGEPSSSSSRPPPVASTSRRRTSSRSPSRDDEGIRERLRLLARNGFRDFRPRFTAEPFRMRNRFSGDYVRDEDFDASYESLLSLAATLGEVKPRVVPEHVLSTLPTALYRDWASTESDKRCPICLDDYKFVDPVMKLSDCGHWLHRDCLKQWLRGASTCPVCRKHVRDPRQSRDRGSSEDPGPSTSRYHRNDEDDEEFGGGRSNQGFFRHVII